MTREEALNTLMKMRAWRAWGRSEQNEKDRPEMPCQKEVDAAFDVCIEALSQPSLSSNLDEAAEEFASNAWLHGGVWHEAQRQTFKAGAEWMAGQGWISVDEKLPELDEEVIVLTDEHNTAPIYKIGFGHIVDVKRCIDYSGWNHPGVKYWMPCPKIPNND